MFFLTRWIAAMKELNMTVFNFHQRHVVIGICEIQVQKCSGWVVSALSQFGIIICTLVTTITHAGASPEMLVRKV